MKYLIPKKTSSAGGAGQITIDKEVISVTLLLVLLYWEVRQLFKNRRQLCAFRLEQVLQEA